MKFVVITVTKTRHLVGEMAIGSDRYRAIASCSDEPSATKIAKALNKLEAAAKLRVAA